MGIKVIESTSAESDHFINLISVRVSTTDMTTTVAGTIYGKRDPRIVQIDSFGLELVPEGHLALIYNEDKPGAIGSIGTTLAGTTSTSAACRSARIRTAKTTLSFSERTR